MSSTVLRDHYFGVLLGGQLRSAIYPLKAVALWVEVLRQRMRELPLLILRRTVGKRNFRELSLFLTCSMGQVAKTVRCRGCSR